ncbi:MAG: hypothetical protein B6D70_09290 [gamma proteobacterium symbiont of Stewartia floridana]|nr:MAG: hypothetical protein B6D69_06825 [gamma proteobacterium symbiont of Stewartia floridana]RLW53763.1 MAG: hypothetical protein B6D76_10175 [gamma proteobacterium symbiont of Stewartia floridana]RLW59660.1 MAG: hypothetical protein B6D75_09255 [gamma proteobacterium symbiont of Stewartia floridana]RLW61414.1 MAG: hypothetical protein B6D70_09290 [gamma proteobacterium symbiont of Stewartia floridana]
MKRPVTAWDRWQQTIFSFNRVLVHDLFTGSLNKSQVDGDGRHFLRFQDSAMKSIGFAGL